MEILDQIQARLSRDGVDLDAVAEAADISRKTVKRLRDGYRTTTFRTVIRITAALDKLYPPKTAKRSRQAATIS